MDNFLGAFFSYKDFRASLHHQSISPKVWKGAELSEIPQALAASDIDIVALAQDKSISGCEVTPGMALAMQWLKPGVVLNGHTHSWWHLFVIQSGNGLLTLGDADEVKVSNGDVLLVPAWTRHGFVNTDTDQPLVMLNMSNMPQMALLSNFADSHGLITTAP